MTAILVIISLISNLVGKIIKWIIAAFYDKRDNTYSYILSALAV